MIEIMMNARAHDRQMRWKIEMERMRLLVCAGKKVQVWKPEGKFWLLKNRKLRKAKKEKRAKIKLFKDEGVWFDEIA